MDWTEGLQNAVEYIEAHLTDELDYEEIAKRAYLSRWHFGRVFGLVCGHTVGEYIRNRRLTLAGRELSQGKKVIDVALEYGYDNPDSFSKAFFRFHGVLPSQAKRRGATLRSFPRFTLQNLSNKGGRYEMKYKIEEKNELVLVGYKRRFSGVPYGAEREKQEEAFFCSTRAKQWLLRGAGSTPETDYCVVTNVDEEGYDFYIAYDVEEWERNALFDKNITGVEGLETWGFETLVIPARKYAIFETDRQKRPIREYADIRKRIVSEWLPASGCRLAEGAEVIVLHWKYLTDRERKYVEIRIPIE